MALYDVFICHTSEDKESFVRPLAEMLRANHIEVWYDEFAIEVGDGLRRSIDRGLANSTFGVVVLSPSFFAKNWPQRELDGLTARQMYEGRGLILPVWHGVSPSDVLEFSPPLADAFALNSQQGLEYVCSALTKRIRPSASPLIIARDILIEHGHTVPVVSDVFWLDLVEEKQELRISYEGIPWQFPLPHSLEDTPEKRGENLATTALQRDWSDYATDNLICQITPPEVVHAFIRKFPGLFDIARDNAETLALYAPQLTLPEFDSGFADIFDDLLASKDRWANSGDTVDGSTPPCEKIIAWRHPTFGNYRPAELAQKFYATSLRGNERSPFFNAFDCLVWLLCDASAWMPQRLHNMLMDGLRARTFSWFSDWMQTEGKDGISYTIADTRRTPRLSTTQLADLDDTIGFVLNKLSVSESAETVRRRFLERNFIAAHIEAEKELRRARQGRS